MNTVLQALDHCSVLTLACGEWWLYRYQTLLAASCAILIAVFQLRISASQAAISKRQAKIMADQIEQDSAFAKAQVEQAARPLINLVGELISHATHRPIDGVNEHPPWSWGPEVLELCGDLNIPEQAQIAQAISKAYPASPECFLRLFSVAARAKALAAEYKNVKWTREDTKSSVSDEVLNELFASSGQCAHTLARE